jgi:biopolymer transport protein ExbD
MSIRDNLITQITTNIAAHSNVSISQELPFDQSGVPLYNKNMSTIYVDEQEIEVEQLYRTLDQGNVNQTTTTVNAYLSVDAKNEYSDINTVISNLLIARNVVTNVTESNSDYETEITDDRITYTFEYNFTTI